MGTPGAAQAPPELTISCMHGDSPSPLPMLSSGALGEALVASGGFWHDVRVVAETGSTNADLLAAAQTGAREGAVIAADSQSAGRGRLGRRWVSPPGTSLSFSVLLRPAAVPAAAGPGCRCSPGSPWPRRCTARPRSTRG